MFSWFIHNQHSVDWPTCITEWCSPFFFFKEALSFVFRGWCGKWNRRELSCLPFIDGCHLVNGYGSELYLCFHTLMFSSLLVRARPPLSYWDTSKACTQHRNWYMMLQYSLKHFVQLSGTRLFLVTKTSFLFFFMHSDIVAEKWTNVHRKGFLMRLVVKSFERSWRLQSKDPQTGRSRLCAWLHFSRLYFIFNHSAAGFICLFKSLAWGVLLEMFDS